MRREAQRQLTEINTGVLASTRMRETWLARVDNQNAQSEFYLPDVLGLARLDGEGSDRGVFRQRL